MNNILQALSLAVNLIVAQQTEIQSLTAANQTLASENENYKQLEAEAQPSIDRLNALLPSPVAVVPGGDTAATDLQAEEVTIESVAVAESLVVAEEKLPDWATPPDPALVPVQIDVPVSM